jgi:hypothetical protein
LLEVLVLGAAGLYLTKTLGQRRLEDVARQWLTRLIPIASIGLAAAAVHQRVVSVFVVQGGVQRPRLVAAEILHDAVELLAEQPLELLAPAGTSWDQLDLAKALEHLHQAVNSKGNAPYPLLLLDPLLQEHRRSVQNLGQNLALLRHPGLQPILKALNPAEQELLQCWLHRPSHTAVQAAPGCAAVMRELANLQSLWAEQMPRAIANVAGVLELSLALANLQQREVLI